MEEVGEDEGVVDEEEEDGDGDVAVDEEEVEEEVVVWEVLEGGVAEFVDMHDSVTPARGVGDEHYYTCTL